MKKCIALLLALVLACSLAGCGRQISRGPDDDSSSSAAPAEPPRTPDVSDPAEDKPNDDGTNNTGSANDAGQSVDFLGSWNGNVYSNELFGFSYTLPDDWEHASVKELLEMADIAVDDELLSDRDRLLTELSESLMVYGMYAYDPMGGNNVQVMSTNLEAEGYAGISDVEYSGKMFAQLKGIYDYMSDVTLSIGNAYRAPLGGQSFVVLPMKITASDNAIEQRMYVRVSGEHGMLVMITAVEDQDIDTMAGGASAFSPLRSVSSGSTGTSGALTATGYIGCTFSTMFFDFTVLSAESPAEYYGYTPEAGNKLIVVRVRVKNNYGDTLTIYDTFLPLYWDDEGTFGEGTFAVDAFNDDMMPLEWELEDGEEATWDMLFEAPADRMDFSLSYYEVYSDIDGNEQTGGWYDAYFTLLASPTS